jgi:hypothetical protein
LEENVFESGLKRPGLCLADSKSGTDFELCSAMNFDVRPAAFFEGRAHGINCERGRVTIATEMTEHDALDFSG